MKHLLYIPAMLFAFIACHNNDGKQSASGTFEATEILVSAQTNGPLLQFQVQEGQEVNTHQCLGYVDTIPLSLRKQQLTESLKAVINRKPVIQVQLAALEQQLQTALYEQSRLEKLVKANAANQKQLDDAGSQVQILRKQLEASRSTLNSTSRSLSNETSAWQSQIDQINDQLHRSYIYSPVNGTVLVKYAEEGELAAPGKVLFKVANLKYMTLRAYITADQLAMLRIGQKIEVLAELGSEKNQHYQGTVTWISSRSEFTPKTIQTRDERSNLVYAIKVTVPNDGILKIGMYGNIRFSENK